MKRVLPKRMAPSIKRWPRSCVKRREGCTLASQSTTRPSMLNSTASNTPITAVQNVMAAM